MTDFLGKPLVSTQTYQSYSSLIGLVVNSPGVILVNEGHVLHQFFRLAKRTQSWNCKDQEQSTTTTNCNLTNSLRKYWYLSRKLSENGTIDGIINQEIEAQKLVASWLPGWLKLSLGERSKEKRPHTYSQIETGIVQGTHKLIFCNYYPSQCLDLCLTSVRTPTYLHKAKNMKDSEMVSYKDCSRVNPV